MPSCTSTYIATMYTYNMSYITNKVPLTGIHITFPYYVLYTNVTKAFLCVHVYVFCSKTKAFNFHGVFVIPCIVQSFAMAIDCAL